MKISKGIGLIAYSVISLGGGFGAQAEDVQKPDVVTRLVPADRQAPDQGKRPMIPQSKRLSADYDYLAPDGSEVRLLVRGDRASMAQFKLPAGHTASAVAHRTVEELWYVVSGSGQMWRSQGEQEDIVELLPGVSLSIPVRTHFQFRATGPEALVVIGVTVPSWPGAEEAYSVDGKWPASSMSEGETGLP